MLLLLYLYAMRNLFNFILFGFFVFLLKSCDNNKITKPAYLNIEKLEMAIDPSSTYGNTSSKITSVWISSNNVNLGAFELPIEIPILMDSGGTHAIKIEPGIDINGISSFRGIYPFYSSLEFGINLIPGETANLPVGSSNIVYYDYDSPQGQLYIKSLENFESLNRQMTITSQSDISWTLTSSPNLKFPAPQGETNTYSGMALLDTGNCKFEVSSNENFILPGGGKNVYVEFDYKVTNPITIGVIASNPGQIIQMPTATFLPNKKWNHAYVNLITEVSGSPQASAFKIFLGSAKLNNGIRDTILVDNLRLLYRE